MFGTGNWVDPALMPGMATTDPSDAEPDATNHTMVGDSIGRITGTGRVKAALPPDIGAENDLVGLDQQDQDLLHRFANSCQYSSIRARISRRVSLSTPGFPNITTSKLPIVA